MLQVAGEAFDDSTDAFDRHLIDVLPVAVVVCGPDGCVVRANPRTTELLGRAPSPGDKFGETVRLFEPDGTPVPEEDYPVSLVLRTESLFDQDFCLERQNGSMVTVRVTAQVLRNDSGAVMGALTTIQNEGADTHRATLAAIIDSSDDAIVSKTLDGVITSWNLGAERIFGYTAAEAVGQHISLIIPTERRAEESEVLARLRRGERVDHFETVRRTKGGQLIDISLTVSPVRGGDGRIVGASKVARDITERNSTHRALGRSQRRYRRLFDSAGVSLWEEDFSAVKAAIDEVRGESAGSFREYLELHPAFVDRCIGLVRVVDVNQSTLRMFGARSKRDLLQGLAGIFDETTREVFAEELVAIAEGRTAFESEVALRTLAGERLDAMLSIRFPQGENPRDPDGSFDSVLVSLTDITMRREAEQALRDSEALFREMADSAPAIIWLTDAAGRFTFLSRRWQEFAGPGGSNIFEGGWWTILHPADSEAVRTAFAESNANRTPFVVECRLRRAAGDYRWVMMPGEPRFDSEGTFLGFIGSVIDITERRVAEDTVRGEVQIRETLANVGASLAAELDPDRLVQAVTDAATHLTSAEVGAFFYNVTNESGGSYELHALASGGQTAVDRNALAAPLFAQFFRGEGIVRIDDMTKDPRPVVTGTTDGSPGQHNVRSYLSVPVVSRSREVLGRLVFGHSHPGMFVARHEQLAAGIASWAALSLDNARLYKTAQDANSTKDEFLATLSHELRTPLNAMLGWTHLLRSGALDGQTRQRALEALERNGRAQAQLVDDLLDVSRIVSGLLQLRADDVDLGAVIGSAIDTVRPAATAKDLTVGFEAPDTQVMVTGDADRLRQIFWNLFTNAVKFTPVHGRIDVTLRAVDGDAEVTVRDTGAGIGADFVHHVFERFRQADSSHARKHGGLGLGLAIVRHLVEAHGGTVGVESPGEGQGSTFRVRMPVRSLRRPQQPARDLEPERGTALSGLHILVVDDERDAREFLAALLLLHGAEVDVAGSAGEALAIIANRRVDLLLADLGLPDRDGYSLIQAIRSLTTEMGGDVPAVAVTAYAGLRERARAFEAGYGWHVAKPVDPDQLLSVVTTATHARRKVPTNQQSPEP